MSMPDTPAKWVPVIQQQCRLSRNIGRADDGGHNRAGGLVQPTITRGEQTADNALLHPRLPFIEFVLGGQARELRARARAAGGAIVSFARAKNKVARTRPGIDGRAEQLDMIHLWKTLGVHRFPDGPGELGERLDIRQFQCLSVVFDEEKPIAAPRDVAGYWQ